MADDKKEPWLNYLALTTVILAVCATLATFKGGGYSTRAVMSQSQASDQWAYYQAKSLKENLYVMKKEQLETDLATRGLTGEAKQLVETKIAEYQKKIDKYSHERKTIEQEAKNLEKIRDDSQLHSKAFGMAVIFLQISILLCSISGLMKKKTLWLSGVAGGSVGLVFFANGFLLFLS